MAKHKEKEDFQLASGEKVFTFEELMKARANLDLFEEIGNVNTGLKDSLKGEPLIDLDKGNFADRTVYRRKSEASGKIGKELIKE